MCIYLLGAEKGGVGKSTIAVHLAALLALQKRDVLLMDTDKSGDASGWAAQRVDQAVPPVPCVRVSDKVSAAVRDASRRYQDIVIDSGGRDSVQMRSAMTVADVMIMPTLASQFDLWQVARVATLVEEARGFNESLQAYALINRASTNWASTEAQEASDLIREYPTLKLLAMTLRERKAYREAVSQGRAVFEARGPGAGKAANEFWAFGLQIGSIVESEQSQSRAVDGSDVEPFQSQLCAGLEPEASHGLHR